jgi:MFS family permease
VTTYAAPDASGTAGASSQGDSRLPRLTVFGLVVVVTVVAIEAMAVATIMPTVVRDLHGIHFYSWAFTAYLLADVVGMVDAGRRTDRSGPRGSLLGGLLLFAAGLVVDATAQDMGMLVAGRVLQGLGGGQLIVAVYVVVARAVAPQLRPRVFAALSAAWVVPALVGPALAGVVTAAFGWRWVFAGIVPLAVIGVVLLVPVLRSLPPHVETDAAEGSGRVRLGTWGGLVLAVGLGLVQAAVQPVRWWSPLLAVAGLAIGVPPLRRLLPAGALRLHPGLPTVVMLRGMLTFGFFGAEAFLPLTLTRLHHGSPSVVGIPLTLGALGWSAGSWWQGRQRQERIVLLRLAFVLVAVGVATLVVVATPETSLWLATPAWLIAGAGMGLGMPIISVLTLELSPAADQGVNSAALQVSDMSGDILGIAAAGAIITPAVTSGLGSALVVSDLGLAGVALLGALATRRIAPHSRRGAG